MTGRRTHIIGLALAVVLCCSASGCGGDGDEVPPDDSSGDTLSTAEDVRDLIEAGASDWLSGFSGLAPLECPPTNTVIVTSDNEVQGCGFQDATGQFVMRIQNSKTVPISVWGADALTSFTVLPKGTLDLGVVGAQFEQYLSFQANTVAGLTSVVLAQVESASEDQRLSGLGWVKCAVEPNTNCVLDTVVNLLPKTVTIRGYRIPARLLGQGLNLAYQNQDLLTSFASDLSSQGPGSLIIRQR